LVNSVSFEKYAFRLNALKIKNYHIFKKNSKQKISLFSRYERVTDRRTFKDRRDVWAIEKAKKEFVPEKPKAKIRQVEDLPKDPKVKSKLKPAKREEEEEENEKQKEEENNEESAREEEHQEEAPPAEEQEEAEEETPANEEAEE